ncbi:MAG: hypothetical protein NW220_01000 [Leptolyngbyaceae cyanobacterium bins.349]|nr:hypothetical protein [Leptolyngbyaceae cyanobacterium bins.349]
MQKVVEVLLGAFLRRYPLPTRVSLFGFLSRYAWLKDILEELRPELFPAQRDRVTTLPEAPATLLPPERILGLLERSDIRGQRGYYTATAYFGARGNGHLFSGMEVTSKQPVTIKEFLLPETQFTKAEALHRQSSFQRLAGLQLADGRLQDFRVIQPLEAIADSETQELCFLVTPALDLAPTLRQQLASQGAFAATQTREVLSQLLQTLDFLHRQKFNLPSGAIQQGLIHGNLSLDSILWTEQAAQPFVYLADLLLWEQYFDPTLAQPRTTEATPTAIQQDLRRVGEIGLTLLQGVDTATAVEPTVAPRADAPLALDPALRLILDSLRTGQYDSAETARRDLLQLAARSPAVLTPIATTPTPEPPAQKWSPLLLLSLLGLLVGAFVLLPRWRSPDSQSIAAPQVTTCCLAEVSAIPTGNFRYTSVQGGTWWTVLQQRNLLQRGVGLQEQLALSQPQLNLVYVPATTAGEALAQMRSGNADFAVMPLITPLPSDVMAQDIAYDGLATVVSFSYAKRKQGLPATLNGQLSLTQVQQLYASQVNDWKTIGGPNLRVQRYMASNPDVIAIFEQKVLNGNPIQTLPDVKVLPGIDLLRQVIRDFEQNDIGSIGIMALSEVWGQCSVYPLALRHSSQVAIQPLVLSNGSEITPETDLCDRKGAYAPDPDRFHNGSYLMSYPIVVVYPRDNRRSAMGKKFVELMRTAEGQQLLKAAGLVPLSRDGSQRSPVAQP